MRHRLTPPKSTTPFVGRERELANLAELLAEPHVRLLSITGPGGIGKTQVALQTARGHTTIFADGAAFVDLAPISDVDLLAQTIAAGIGVKLSVADNAEPDLLAASRTKNCCWFWITSSICLTARRCSRLSWTRQPPSKLW